MVVGALLSNFCHTVLFIYLFFCNSLLCEHSQVKLMANVLCLSTLPLIILWITLEDYSYMFSVGTSFYTIILQRFIY